ncbi:Proteasome subunit alpha type-2 [Gaertneriomyces sp. JEL0708]|nr:Proteasome subunit alpha type-2 [Gaertneriomyces sp. JEL0708]
MDCPKPLFPIAGQPMIYHHVQALAKLPGMKEILLVGFFENSVFDRFLTQVQMEYPTISIRYLREYEALGTGGGLFHFRDQIVRGDPDHIFVLNADIASSFPLVRLLETHTQHQGVGTILTVRVERSLVSKYGCVVANPETLEVLHFVEKPESHLSDMISCGIYVFRKEIFQAIQQAVSVRQAKLQEQGLEESTIKHGPERIQLEQDVLSLLTSTKKLFTHVCHPVKDFWMQIKTGSSCIPANRLYLQHFLRNAPRQLSTALSPATILAPELSEEPGEQAAAEVVQPAYIHPTAIIHPSAKLGPNVSVGPRVLIARGVRVKDSILLDGVEIKNDSCILNSVIGWESVVGAWSRVEGAPGESDALNATLKGYKIPSATILGKSVTIGDEIAIRNCIVLPYKDIKTNQHNEILM